MTPTASAVADLVLPVAMSPERDCLRVWFEPMRSLTKACAPYYEAKEDEQIMIDLGHRLSPDKWPDWVQAPRDYMNWRLDRDGVGMTMEDLENREHGMYYYPYRYRKHEKGPAAPGRATGLHDADGALRAVLHVLRCDWRRPAPVLRGAAHQPLLHRRKHSRSTRSC